MTEQELEPYRLQERQCTIMLLEGVELKDENKQSIENTYNECIEENNRILKYYEIIIDNYHYDSCNMSNNYFKH